MDQWNNQGGGYFGENGVSTPTTDSKSKPAARQQFLCPVTIRQVLEAPEEGLKVGSYSATTITIAGVAFNVDVSSTNIKFSLSDDTGCIDCLEWLETEDTGEVTKKTPCLIENSYYQVFGCVKSLQGSRRIMVFKIVPIADFNDYTAFMAEVLSVNRYAEKMNRGMTAMDVSSAVPQYNKVGMGGGHDNNASAFTSAQRAILDAIKAVDSQFGWSKNDGQIKSKFSVKQIEDALEFLIGEGHIYTTIDDDHFSSFFLFFCGTEHYGQNNMSLRARWKGMSAYDIHKMIINEYVLTKKGTTSLLRRNPSGDKRDIDVIRENHKFLWDDDESAKTWGEQLAKKYYDRLFKEYCIGDLSLHKENKVGLRWRTENELLQGKGQFSCGEKHCSEEKELKSWEVNFAYVEENTKKNALVKIRLCPKCGRKLNYRFKRKEVKRLTEPKKVSSVEISSAVKETLETNASASSSEAGIWKNESLPATCSEKSQHDELDDFLQDLFL